MKAAITFSVIYSFLTLSQNAYCQQDVINQPDSAIHFKKEKHFNSVRQLTFGGDNAEAYFSFNNKSLVFQVTNPAWNVSCDQIYYSNLEEFNPKLLSTGKGRTTCSSWHWYSVWLD